MLNYALLFHYVILPNEVITMRKICHVFHRRARQNYGAGSFNIRKFTSSDCIQSRSAENQKLWIVFVNCSLIFPLLDTTKITSLIGTARKTKKHQRKNIRHKVKISIQCQHLGFLLRFHFENVILRCFLIKRGKRRNEKCQR